jgi:hypothetical protein
MKAILNTHTTNSIDAIINYVAIAAKDENGKPIPTENGFGKAQNSCKDVRLVIDVYGHDGRMESPNVVTLPVYFLRDLLRKMEEIEAETIPDQFIDDLPF